MIDAVLKIGGRLGRGKHLRALCEEVAALGRRRRLLIVPGGGVFADAVRRCDERVGLSDTAAHWMAILAMDQYGYLLVDSIPGSTAVRSLEEARAAANEGGVPVLLPYDLVKRVDALPHSWSVTADSIAAWVAGLAGAGTLVLLKDRRGLGSPVNRSNDPRGDGRGGLGVGGDGPGARGVSGDGPDARGTRVSGDDLAGTPLTLDLLAGWEGVDGYLAHLVDGAGFDLWIVDGERPGRITELLTTGRTVGIHLPRSDPSAGVPRHGPLGRSGDPRGTPPSARR